MSALLRGLLSIRLLPFLLLSILLLSILLGLALFSGAAQANPVEDAQRRALEDLRRRVANQVQLSAYDMLDQLVYEMTQAPPFDQPTLVFLADMTVPIGLGTGLEGLLENHLSSVLLGNPSSRLTLAHCPSCTAMVLQSGPAGTIVSRGLDNPEALAKLGGAEGRHGLYIDFAAEGAWLVLRARITKLTPDLPIVWSKTLTSAAGAPSLLRQPTALKSAADARQEYLDALNDRRPIAVPIRFTLRSYEISDDSGTAPPPVLWLQSGFEFALTQAHEWLASLVLGFAWLPEAYDGVMIQARMSRLISGTERSLTAPDLYLFLGGALMTLNGPAIAPFATDNFDQLRQQAQGSLDTRATFGGLHLGFELRVGNRLGASVFLENMPAYNGTTRMGTFLSNDIIEFHSFGAEVSLWF